MNATYLGLHFIERHPGQKHTWSTYCSGFHFKPDTMHCFTARLLCFIFQWLTITTLFSHDGSEELDLGSELENQRSNIFGRLIRGAAVRISSSGSCASPSAV